MNQSSLRLSSTLVFSLFLFSIVNAKMEKMENEIMSLMEKYRVAGLSVAHAFGYNDSIALQTDDIFRIASLSKLFVGTAIMGLWFSVMG